MLAEGATFRGGCVAGAHPHPHLGDRPTEPLGGERDAGQGGAEVPVDVVGERLQGRDVQDAQAGIGRRRRISVRIRSRHQRKAASVLPLPVGAQMSVWSPAAMAGQPSDCGAVGASKDAENHSRVAGSKGRSGSGGDFRVRAGTGPASYHRRRDSAHAFYIIWRADTMMTCIAPHSYCLTTWRPDLRTARRGPRRVHDHHHPRGDRPMGDPAAPQALTLDSLRLAMVSGVAAGATSGIHSPTECDAAGHSQERGRSQAPASDRGHLERGHAQSPWHRHQGRLPARSKPASHCVLE